MWVLVPGVNSGKIGLVIRMSDNSDLKRHAWCVLINGKIYAYIDYLLSPIRDDIDDDDELTWC